MRTPARCAWWMLVLVVLALVGPAPPVAASSADLAFSACASDAGPGNGECQHFLRNPAGATDDECWCDKCRNGARDQRHDGKTLPWGWNASQFQSPSMECYLKRHAVAWGIVCSACVTNDKSWPDGGAGPEKDFAGRPAKDTVLARLEAEKHLFKKADDVVLAYNRDFYLVTDVSGLKVRTATGASRVISTHEWAHLMIERACFARREWVRNLGEPIVMRGKQRRPVAIYVPERFRDFEKVGAEYFKQKGSNGLRGPVADLCDGMCLTGITFSREECGDDRRLAHYLRHGVSHALLSMWGSLETRPKSLPVWLDEGLAHWLTKSSPPYRDGVFYCTSEGLGGPSVAGGPAWPGKDWDKDVVRYAQSAKLASIESLLAKTVLSDMTEEDQKRAWSVLDCALTDLREPFAKVLAALRREENVREAFTKNLGMTPEQFDQRWKDRVLGRTKSMADAPAAAAGADDAPGATDRRAIAAERAPHALAARIRQLGEIRDRDRATVPVVVDVIAQDLDLPRETALVTLLQVKDPGCRETLWQYGLAHTNAMVRAYVARICGRLRIAEALPKLEAQLEDANWYARAEAAVACAALGDRKVVSGLRKMAASDSSEKARVGAMDALAAFPDDAGMTIPIVAKHLRSAQWQLRIAAAQTLGALGSMEGVEPLLARLEEEPTGRVADDLRRALARITRDDLGRRPENWRKWWEREKASAPGGLPKRPEAPRAPAPGVGPGASPADAKATRDDGPAPYFGVEIYSNRVAFVCDVSESMRELFTPDPAAAKALSREYSGTDKLTILKEEVQQAMAALDPRAYFNVVAFSTQVRAFRPSPVPANPGNVDQARSFVRSFAGSGETNYYDALKGALDLGDAPDTNPDFRATPDTVTFLTDGEPTKGDIVDGDVLLEWYTGLNRYARVRTHTITFGTINVDVRLLRALAERNDGTFMLVPEKNTEKAPPK